MNVTDILRTEWEYVGLKAPALIWVGAAVLLAGTAALLFRLWWKVRREKALHGDLRTKLEAVLKEFPRRPGEGLTLEAWDALDCVFGTVPSLRVPWSAYKAGAVAEVSASGEDQYWSTDSAEASFTDGSMIESRLNRSFYVAVPGLVTSIGLLLTFTAILIALLGVRVEKDQVQGLDLLVAGLSGKFLSSVVALLGASVFLVLERRLLHGLSDSRRQLVARIDAIVPRRTPAHMLAALQRDLREGSDAFRHFNSDLSGRLKQSMSESMGPTMTRMVESIEELNKHLRAGEEEKKQSLTGSFGNLVQDLERSINGTLEKMGDQFSTSLSGGATQHFEEVARSLSGTAALLEGMNEQFRGTQTVLNELVGFARTSTEEQMALGRTQVEELTNVLRQLMKQLEETAGSSVSSMSSALTTVVRDLSSQIEALGGKMAESVARSAGAASSAASQAVGDARATTTSLLREMNTQFQKNQDALNEITTSMRASTERQVELGRSQVEELTAVLRQLMGQLQETTGSSVSTLSSAMATVVAELSDKVTALGNNMAGALTESAGQATTAAGHVVGEARQWAEQNAQQLTELLQRHESHVARVEALQQVLDQTLARFREGLGEYATVTGDLKRVSSDVGTIAAKVVNVTDTMRTVERGFEQVATQSAAQVESLSQANQRQQETWQRIEHNLVQYERTFLHVDKAATELLTQISSNLRDYTQVSQKTFDTLVSVSNETIGNAVNKLGGAISELEEYLSEFGEVLARTRPTR